MCSTSNRPFRSDGSDITKSTGLLFNEVQRIRIRQSTSHFIFCSGNLFPYPTLHRLQKNPSPKRRENPNLSYSEMSYDDVEIEDMEWKEDLKAYTYPCPCGDLFQITLDDLRLGEEIARCPSCSLYITVVYNPEDFSPSKEPPTSNKPNPQPIAVA
ncbi:hypothetical protein LUZ61_011578 [Rhynchospora tenuis]|uniref:Diphthamide biosynthesis protein 3 n=1 Tax=Rhynchospora tenuis TaxID=198213 RepID=A0AAD6A1R1_9POAL|nr:hypothetical protein LUZ61_011578 [Rhynchospora tenuis]